MELDPGAWGWSPELSWYKTGMDMYGSGNRFEQQTCCKRLVGTTVDPLVSIKVSWALVPTWNAVAHTHTYSIQLKKHRTIHFAQRMHPQALETSANKQVDALIALPPPAPWRWHSWCHVSTGHLRHHTCIVRSLGVEMNRTWEMPWSHILSSIFK